MAVNKAPVRQQSYLTEYDRQMAQYLRQMGGSIGAQDIAAEAYGGKFPVGTMTAKILSSVLARASEKRAMNREEMGKDYSSKAYEIADAQDRGLNAMPGELGVDQSGNLDLLPTTALQTADGVTNRQPYVFKEDSLNDGITGPITNNATSYATNTADEREMLSKQRVDAFANASPEAPLGVPYARQDVALTVGEPTGDSTQLGRYLSGTLEQDILPTNANKALSASLRGANIDEREFADYRLDRKMATMPKREVLEVFDKNNTPTYVVKSYNPTTGITTYNNKETNELINIGEYSTKKRDIATKTYTVTNMDGVTITEQLTDTEAAIRRDSGMSVVPEDKSDQPKPFEVMAQEIVLKNNSLKIDQNNGNIIGLNGEVYAYHPTHPDHPKNKNKKSSSNNNEQPALSEEALMEKINEESGENARVAQFEGEMLQESIKNFKTTQFLTDLESELINQKNNLKKYPAYTSEYKILNDNITNTKKEIKEEKKLLQETKNSFKYSRNLMNKIGNEVSRFNRDSITAINMLNTLIERGTSAAFNKQRAKRVGTIENKLVRQLKSLQGRIAYAELQKMRNSNKTGGGVGALSEKELTLFEQSQGVIDLSDLGATLRTLEDLKVDLNQAFKQDEEWYTTTYGRDYK